MRLVSHVVLAALLGALAPTRSAAADPPPPPSRAPHRSPRTALGLSAGITGASLATVIGGFVLAGNGNDPDPALMLVATAGLWLGPSTGRWYGGEVGAGSLAVRTAGFGLMALAAIEGGDGADRLLPIGALMCAGSTIYDLATAPRAARRWNRAHELTVMPSLVPSAHGPAAGLALGGRF